MFPFQKLHRGQSPDMNYFCIRHKLIMETLYLFNIWTKKTTICDTNRTQTYCQQNTSRVPAAQYQQQNPSCKRPTYILNNRIVSSNSAYEEAKSPAGGNNQKYIGIVSSLIIWKIRRPLRIGVLEYRSVCSDDHMTICHMPICPYGPDRMIICSNDHISERIIM